MTMQSIKKAVSSYQDFPSKGILFRDVLPILKDPETFDSLIENMAGTEFILKSDAILAIDARGFIFGTAVAIKSRKPLVVARKPGKLPGELISKEYTLEYGKNSLSIQKESIEGLEKFAIVDDLLATGGTVNCVADILKEANKSVLGLSVVIELTGLNGKKNLDFPVVPQLTF